VRLGEEPLQRDQVLGIGDAVEPAVETIADMAGRTWKRSHPVRSESAEPPNETMQLSLRCDLLTLAFGRHYVSPPAAMKVLQVTAIAT
jgi:hypothetical protein